MNVKPRRRIDGRRRLGIATFVVVAALAFLVLRGLGDATVYFRTADQAVAEKAKLGDRRFRIEGTVEDGTVTEQGNGVVFAIQNNGVTVPVVHRGDPPELFRANIPVVLEGHFAKTGGAFASDRIMVKHSETYTEDNPSRVDKYVGKNERANGSGPEGSGPDASGTKGDAAAR